MRIATSGTGAYVQAPPPERGRPVEEYRAWLERFTHE
jgi:hypothetical protein